MPRMTVYIPDDLKARMEKTRDEINWSQLACAAFERKLGDIASGKARKNMDDVIERLRASKQSPGTGRFKAGFEVGQDWARDTAEASELENLERFHDLTANRTKYEKTWIGIFDLSIDHDYDSLPEALFYHIRPSDDDDSSEAEAFWEKLGGNDWQDLPGSWFRGFCEGALDIWRQVKDKL
jgi:hypothetical protein